MEIHIARRSGDDRPSPAYHVDGLPRQLTQLQLEDAVVDAFAKIEQLQSELDAERLWIKEGKKLHQVQQTEISQLRRELASVTADRDERAIQKGDLLRYIQEQQVHLGMLANKIIEQEQQTKQQQRVLDGTQMASRAVDAENIRTRAEIKQLWKNFIEQLGLKEEK